MIRRPPRSTLFPYTTLFRSVSSFCGKLSLPFMSRRSLVVFFPAVCVAKSIQDGNWILSMPRIRLFAALLALFTLSLQFTTFATSQRSALDTYAITNAKIVTVSGPVIEKGTVVIRDGLIAAVGEKVSAPADARVIDGTGLTIYPGLFDANTSLGIPAPSPAPSPAGGAGGFLLAQLRPTTPGGGPNSTQPPGLQPEVMAEDSIKPGGSSWIDRWLH